MERHSAVPLVFLSRLPRWVLLVAIFVLLVIGMVGSGPVGAAGLAVLFLLLAWFAYLNWPTLDMGGRALRLVALAILAVFTVGHLL